MEFRYPWQFDARRSAVHAGNGMVATSHPLAARVGVRVLEDGGTAADAAVATAAVLNVVEPHMTGIGGDAFALTHFDGEYRALNASGRAPAAATRERYRADLADGAGEPPTIPETGGLPVTVPGAAHGWQALLDAYGRRSLDTLLAPAIDYAREGVPVPEYVAREFRRAAERASAFKATTAAFGLDGETAPGDELVNPALAASLETLGRDGPAAIYGGDLGRQIVDTVRDHGGLLSLSDLADHESTWETPIATTYRGTTVLEHPPNGQGVVALEALNIAERLGVGDDPTDSERIHRLVEATKAAFADGYATVGDPAQVSVPTERLISPAHAEARAAEIGPMAARYDVGLPGFDTTAYLAVVDGDGNAVSFINSNYASFGSCLTVGGFVLQNRGRSFSLDADHPNRLAPRKRPFHTIIPAMLREDDRFAGAFGVVGGPMQPQGHLQVVTNMVDAGLNPQAALDAPRFRWLEGDRVALETSRLPSATVADLRDRGHEVVTEEQYFHDEASHWGGGQVIAVAEDGTLVGGSDPRKDGQAVGF